MPTGYQIKDQESLYFLTLQVVGWVDIFTRKIYKDIVIENLKYCTVNKGLEIYGYVIMSNHIHLLAKSSTGEISKILRDFKSYTSKRIIETIQEIPESRKDWMLSIFKNAAAKNSRNSNFQFWTHENHAEHIYSNNFIQQKLEYIHNNPVRAGLVENAEEYMYSSAKNYAGEKGLLDIELLTIQWKTYN